MENQEKMIDVYRGTCKCGEIVTYQSNDPAVKKTFYHDHSFVNCSKCNREVFGDKLVENPNPTITCSFLVNWIKEAKVEVYSCGEKTIHRATYDDHRLVEKQQLYLHSLKKYPYVSTIIWVTGGEDNGKSYLVYQNRTANSIGHFCGEAVEDIFVALHNRFKSQ